VTATEKKSTVKYPGRHIQGVLFLTAGYGTRAEPLSFCRPKALLPWRDTTLLGDLIDRFAVVAPETIAFNASRCPELILQEGRRHWDGRTQMLFEERPLGLPGTLSRNRELFSGHWIVTNTDMVLDVPIEEMVEFHLKSGSRWTVLTGDFPEYGKYGSLWLNGRSRHYLGVSIISPEVAAICAEEQLATGFFSSLRSAAAARGIFLNEFFAGAGTRWLDMGEPHLFRKHLLARGNFIHPSAVVSDEATIEGFCWIGSSCIINSNVLIRNSVVLEGSELLSGASLIDNVLPWFSRRS